jgi:hypothetical protein
MPHKREEPTSNDEHGRAREKRTAFYRALQ